MIHIYRDSPALSYRIGFSGTTIKQAREHLSGILSEYKKDYSRGMKVRAHCYWRNRYSIVVHAINGDNLPGDRIEYRIVTA